MMHVRCHSGHLAATMPVQSAAPVVCPASHHSAMLAMQSGMQDLCICATSRQAVCYAANRTEAAQDVAAESARRQDRTATTASGDASAHDGKTGSPAAALQQEQQTPVPLWHVPWDDWCVCLSAEVTSPQWFCQTLPPHLRGHKETTFFPVMLSAGTQLG